MAYVVVSRNSSVYDPSDDNAFNVRSMYPFT